MRPILLLAISISSVTLAAPLAFAGPTRWNASVGYGAGAFGVSGRFAEENHAEGGALLRIPARARIGDWELEGDLILAGGAAESNLFDDYSFTSWGLHAKRYLTIRYHRPDRDAGVHFEAYVRGSAQKLSVSQGAEESMWGYGGGVGLQVRISLGHKAVRPSMSLWLDVGRVYTGDGGDALGDSQFQIFSIGFSILGLGR